MKQKAPRQNRDLEPKAEVPRALTGPLNCCGNSDRVGLGALAPLTHPLPWLCAPPASVPLGPI